MRLIDADKFKAYMLEEYICYDHTLADIDKQPTVDAEPVRHGHWKVDEDGNIECSECGHHGVGDNYCERCGAKMDNVEENE